MTNDVECNVCKETGKPSGCLECKMCLSWCHHKCVGVKSREEAELRTPFFLCPSCIQAAAQRDLEDPNENSSTSSSYSNAGSDDVNASAAKESVNDDDNKDGDIDGAIGAQGGDDESPAELRQRLKKAEELIALFERRFESMQKMMANMVNSTSPPVINQDVTRPAVSSETSTKTTLSAPVVSMGSSPLGAKVACAPATSFTAAPAITHAAVNQAPPPPGPPAWFWDDLAQRLASPREPPQYQITLPHALRQYRVEPLPVFDGNSPEVWASFEAIYRYMKADKNLPKDELIAEISAAVKGNARKHIEDLLLVRADPDDMIEALRKPYGDHHRVLGKIVCAIEKAKAPRDLGKERLIEFALLVKSLVTTATAFNQIDYLSHPFLADKIAEKLRDEHQDWWYAEKKRNPQADVRTLAEYLMERTNYPSANNTTNRLRDARCNLHDEVVDPTVNEQKTDANQKPEELGINPIPCECFYCHEEHRLRRCPAFRKLAIADRWNWVREVKLCSACMASTSHNWQRCPFTRRCNVRGCKRNHHYLLHQSTTNVEVKVEEPKKEPVAAESKKEAVVVKPTTSGSTMVHESNVRTLFNIVPVLIKTPSGKVAKEYALLDLGSNRTLMDVGLYEELGLRGVETTLKLRWTQDVETVEESFVTKVSIKGLSSQKWRSLNGISTVPNLNLPTQSLDVEQMKKQYKHLEEVAATSYINAKPRVLIGLQHANLCVGRRMRSGTDFQPTAMKTPLGWVVFGNHQTSDLTESSGAKSARVHLHDSSEASGESIAEQLKRYITFDSLGVTSEHTPPEPIDEAKAKKIARDTLKYVGGRYEIGLLWKTEDAALPNNYKAAVRRLQSVEKSLRATPALLEWTNTRIREMVERGYARRATEAELRNEGPRTWYLPTFVIVNRNKCPPKPRLVFDAAAKYRGTSLNDNLLVGPDLVTSLIGNVCHFREAKYVVAGDVMEMYHQVRITEEDQSAQRFLWRDCDPAREPTIYVLQVMAFGTAPSSFCAQYVKNQHAAKYAGTHPRAAQAITDFMYVDDYLDAHDDIEVAVSTSITVMKILDEAGFKLRSLQSNSVEILRRLPQDRVKAESVELNIEAGAGTVTKILGMSWDPVQDVLTFRLNDEAISDSKSEVTKRGVLSTVMKIFDPIGHLAHILVRGKILLQRIWVSGTDWDEPIDPVIANDWKEWVRTVRAVNLLQISRRYAPVNLSEAKVQLHLFCDASEEAYAATAYFRIQRGPEVHVAHVMAKTKVMPVKPMTIPRAELNAAVLATRLASTVVDSHTFKIEDVIYWTDSKCVLAWINSSQAKFKPYVKFRIGEVLDTSNRSQWRYVPSSLNVADDATKPKPDALDTSSRWFSGPPFLLSNPEEWPAQEPQSSSPEVFVGIVGTDTLDDHEATDAFPLLCHISPKYSHEWQALKRVVAYRIRFLNSKILRKEPPEEFLTPTELHQAQLYIFRSIQARHFPQDLAALKRSGAVPKTSKLYACAPMLGDDGLIRLRSRLQNSKLSYAAKNPVLLPNKDEYVEALIRYHHRRCLHQGEDTVIAAIRQEAWILRIRTAVKRVKRCCILCKLLYARPQNPRMADLPDFRLDGDRIAFTHVGVDAAGPFDVIVRRTIEKRWVLIFTCLVTRAVHFEVIEDMSADRTLMAIRDFRNLRGPTQHLYSDCGKNFQGAINKYDEDLRNMLPKLAEDVAKRYSIYWHFNPARTPHWGGAWERLIRTFKVCLKAEMKESPRKYTPHSFRSAILEVMNQMNSRPLAGVSMDSEDEAPLTPNDFIFHNSNHSSTAGVFTEKDVCSKSAYRRSMHLANQLRKRWLIQYLPHIAKAEKWREDTKPIELGEVVMLAYPNDPRETWRKAVVIKVHPGKDGRVRVATVREASGRMKVRSVATMARLGVISRQDLRDGPEDVDNNRDDHPAAQ